MHSSRTCTFSTGLQDGPITNQNSSGRCWLFATTSDGGLAEAIAAVLKAGVAANGGGAKGCNELGVVDVDGADADATANGGGAEG